MRNNYVPSSSGASLASFQGIEYNVLLLEVYHLQTVLYWMFFSFAVGENNKVGLGNIQRKLVSWAPGFNMDKFSIYYWLNAT